MLEDRKAIVLFSGGQDSTTCLAWALDRFDTVETIGFAYGQRHAVELTCREPLRDAICQLRPGWAKHLGADHMIDLSTLGAVSESALTKDLEIALTNEGLPTTFVPGRNLVFLTFGAIIAYRRGAKHIVAGMCETDFSGYPDCRDDTVKAVQLALNLGMARQFVVHTPLMWIDKAATWTLADRLGGAELVELIVRETHTCYYGDRTHRHDWGYGCGSCPACELRARGFTEFSAAASAAAYRTKLPQSGLLHHCS